MHMDEQENDVCKLKFDINKEKHIKKEPGPFMLCELAMNCYLTMTKYVFVSPRLFC